MHGLMREGRRKPVLYSTLSPLRSPLYHSRPDPFLRGLLAYLLSRPDNWRVIVKDLQRRGDLGRDEIYALLRELRRAGYVVYIQAREPGGRVQQ
jgi:hypothetical protein